MTDRDVGLRLIILYKTAKGLLELALAIALGLLTFHGLAGALQEFAVGLRVHVTRAWSVKAAEFLLVQSTPRNLEVAALALFLDGALTFTEGWGLHLRKKWAEWLVVVASGLLLPFEVIKLVERVRVGRAIVFIVNLAIVVYMARRVFLERRERAPA